MPRSATVATGIRVGWNACTTAKAATPAKHHTSTGTGCSRSESQPPTGPGGHGQDHEPGGTQRAVGGAQAVRGRR